MRSNGKDKLWATQVKTNKQCKMQRIPERTKARRKQIATKKPACFSHWGQFYWVFPSVLSDIKLDQCCTVS